jgi:N-acetylglutamate synthase-like GNAT family acetyltransferase
MIMSRTSYAPRRATVEDLPQLLALWRLERLPSDALEKRFTEFQVVGDDSGEVLGAIGIQIAGSHGLLHSESIAKPELADEFRQLLWKRLQVIIQNHALERLWTKLNGNFWRDRGFVPASADQVKTLPPLFGAAESGWQTITLRAAEANAAVEREMAQFKTLQQEETARLQERVRFMKRFALGITLIVFLLVIVWAVVLLKYGPQLLRGH